MKHWQAWAEAHDVAFLNFFPLFFGAYALEQKGALYIGGFAAAVNLGYTLLVAAERIVPPHVVVRGGIVENGDLISSHLVVTLLLVVDQHAAIRPRAPFPSTLRSSDPRQPEAAACNGADPTDAYVVSKLTRHIELSV